MLETATPWDVVAEGYAAVTVKLFGAYSERALDLVGVGRGTEVADIGAGPGTLALRAARRGARVRAVDFAPNMVALLRKAAAEEGLPVDATVGDGQALAYADASADAAFSMFALMFFPDRPRGMAELLRVLRPGGGACVSSWAPVNRSPIMAALFGALRQVKPDMPEPAKDLASLENPAVLKAEMEAAGFAGVAVHAVEDIATVESARAFWDDMARGAAPVAMLRRTMTDADWAERSMAAVDWLDREVGPFPVRLGATAWLGVGRKPSSVPGSGPAG